MKILNKIQFYELMRDNYPDGGIVFAEYNSSNIISELMVTTGMFGAKYIVPIDGEVYESDWDITQYYLDDKFAVYDNDDILQMIQNLTSGLRVDLHAWFDD